MHYGRNFHIYQGIVIELTSFFILYLENSIKQDERMRRKKGDAINVVINHIDQHLPVDMEWFYSSSENKVQLQQFFIKWLSDTYNDKKPVYLRGSHHSNLTSCFKIAERNIQEVHCLRCDYEEADDRIMYHINYAVTAEGFENVVIASADTDIYICSIFHFNRCMYSQLQGLWILCGQGASSRAVANFIIQEIFSDKQIVR